MSAVIPEKSATAKRAGRMEKSAITERVVAGKKPELAKRAVTNEKPDRSERLSAAKMLHGTQDKKLRTIAAIDRAIDKLEDDHLRRIAKAQVLKQAKGDSEWFSIREIYHAACKLAQPFSMVDLGHGLKINMRAPCPELLNVNGRIGYLVERGFLRVAGTRTSDPRGPHKRAKLYSVVDLASIPKVLKIRERYRAEREALYDRRNQLETAQKTLSEIVEGWGAGRVITSEQRRHVSMLEWYVNGKTLAFIGRKFKVSRERVRQVLEELVHQHVE